MRRIETRIRDVAILEYELHEDHRGYLTESYHMQNMKDLAECGDFVQDIHTYSAQAGTIRAFGYQFLPKAQTKLVRVLKGAIYDVAVDIRMFTYKQWVGVILTDTNRRQLLVPKGLHTGTARSFLTPTC